MDDPATMSEGADRIQAGGGNDEVYASRGRDVIDAGAGADRVFSFESGPRQRGASRISCGAGVDWVDPGRGDSVRACERLFVPMGCHRCSVTLEANVRGKRVVVATVWVPLNGPRLVLVRLTSRAVRSLLERSGSVRLRTVQPGRKGPVAREWFVLRR